jgi:Rieske 2Fe-2S family protein
MLKRTFPTLPSPYYFDPKHHAVEMDRIWCREWLCLAHESEFSGPGAFRVYRLGTAQVIVARHQDGALHAFHNTCRHRGSQLCSEDSGAFRNGRIVCPYHGWAYSLDGALTHTPRRIETADFDPADYSLYPVPVDTWRGFVFVNLAATPRHSLVAALGEEAGVLANWPLEDLRVAHQDVQHLACNWKIFWENYSECLHCPVVHKDLCALVPIYGLGLSYHRELPEDHPMKGARSCLADGKETWSPDGHTPLPPFCGLTGEERDRGMTFADFLPGAFMVAHVDYLRSVHILPLGPERTRLTVNWLLPATTMTAGNIDMDRLTRFARQVIAEDQAVCESNQAGLHCEPHRQGVLMPQEEGVLEFDNWVRERLGEPILTDPTGQS